MTNLEKQPLSKDDRFALDCSHRYGSLRPTATHDVIQMNDLVERGLMSRGSGPISDDARCGFYWIITDKGRKAIK